MNTKPFGLIALLLLAGPALARAQDAAPSAPPPPGAAAAGATAAGPGVVYAAPTVQADLLFPYAFRWHTTGIVGDIGGIWHGNFFGGELSYYDARPHAYSWYNPAGAFGGRVHYRDNITTLNAAYRYEFPLWGPSGPDFPAALTGYVGGSVGVAWLDFHNSDGSGYNGFVGGPGYSDTNKGRFDANAVAGLNWNFSRNVALKVGYRFVWVDRAHLFYDTTRIDSGALEAGLGFKF